MNPLDMHRSPWFFLFCVNVAFLAGIVVAEDRRIEAATAQATVAVPVATMPTCAPDTRSWVAQGFREPEVAK